MIIFQISETGKSKSVPKLHEMSEIGMYFCSRNTYIPPTSVIFFFAQEQKKVHATSNCNSNDTPVFSQHSHLFS